MKLDTTKLILVFLLAFVGIYTAQQITINKLRKEKVKETIQELEVLAENRKNLKQGLDSWHDKYDSLKVHDDQMTQQRDQYRRRSGIYYKRWQDEKTANDSIGAYVAAKLRSALAELDSAGD